jgi:CspA family cold shock protein
VNCQRPQILSAAAIDQEVMTNGTVKFFNSAKGFGFITPDGGGKDVFIPATSITSSGIPGLKAGQRVSFETEPDSKGPKAVKLAVLAEPPRIVPPTAPPIVKERPAQDAGRLTVYLDPESEESDIVLDTLRAAGHEPRIVDYIATPPTKDELRNLSMLLRDADQSLARKYDHMFHELRLDDRFISENEFWTAIAEHPSLINGPVLTNDSKARVCRTENAVRSFLGIDTPREAKVAAKPKGVPERLAGFVKTGTMPAPVLKKEASEKPAEAKKEAKEEAKQESLPVEKPRPKTDAAVGKKAKPQPPIKAKAKTATKTEAKPKVAAKPKKAVKSPAKKAQRAGA